MPISSAVPIDENGKTLRLLGIDTALRTTGFGVVDSVGNHLRAVDCGVIKTKKGQPLSECLRRLAGGIRELAETYAPDVAVIEGAFYCRNANTAMVLGSARGAVIATLAELSIPMYEYAPRKVKQSVCGHGNASKQQVALMVSHRLNIRVCDMPDDATYALALTICHAQSLSPIGVLTIPQPL